MTRYEFFTVFAFKWIICILDEFLFYCCCCWCCVRVCGFIAALKQLRAVTKALQYEAFHDIAMDMFGFNSGNSFKDFHFLYYFVQLFENLKVWLNVASFLFVIFFSCTFIQFSYVHNGLQHNKSIIKYNFFLLLLYT